MNRDFTEKKSDICLKKKFVQRVSPKKKNSCTSSEQKKYSCKLKIPLPPSPPPITFLMVRPLHDHSCMKNSRHFFPTFLTQSFSFRPILHRPPAKTLFPQRTIGKRCGIFIFVICLKCQKINVQQRLPIVHYWQVAGEEWGENEIDGSRKSEKKMAAFFACSYDRMIPALRVLMGPMRISKYK